MKHPKAPFALLGMALAAILGLAQGAAAASARSCCRVAAGTKVEVELVDAVSTQTFKTGDAVALRLAEPLIVGREVVLRAGTPGVGYVVEAAKPGIGGKPAKLVLAARYLEQGRVQAPLQALQLAAAGRSNATAAQVVGLGGIAFAPLGFIGLAVQGGDVAFPAGTRATAEIAADVTLRPIARATSQMLAEQAREAAAQASASAAAERAAVDIPPPPSGEGQVVFFRRKSILGIGQWIKVRENGRTLGTLNNGTYFVDVTDPGRHAFSATMEPELKDRLTLEVAPGETLFVEGVLTKGLVLGAADLSPSNRATFDKVSDQLSQPSSSETSAASDEAPSDGPPAAPAAASAASAAPPAGGQ